MALRELILNLFRHRELLYLLTWREVVARYKQSLLGPLWALLQPLALMLVFTAIRSFVPIPSEGVPYPLFAYAGLLPWTLFTTTVGLATPSIVANAAIVKKIYFPREIFPVSAALVATFDFAMAFVMLLLLMLGYGFKPPATMVLVIPLLLVQQTFSVGVVLLTSALGTFRRDIIFAAVFILQIWLYLTPVIYPLSAVSESWRGIYLINPMAGIVASQRAVLVYGQLPSIEIIGPPLLIAPLFLMLGYTVFKRLERHYADVV